MERIQSDFLTSILTIMPEYTYTDAVEPTLLTEGTYDFTVTRVEDAISATGGNPMLKLELTERHTQAVVKDQLVFTPKAAWKIDLFLKACGFSFEKGESVDVDESLILNKRFSAQVGIEEYTKQDGSTGKVNRIGRYEFPAVGTAKPKAKPETKPEPVKAEASDDWF
jgi:hypothetical protein